MSGRMIRAQGTKPEPAEIAVVLRSFRRDFGDLVGQARAYRLSDDEIRALLDEVLDERLCAGPADWRRQLDEEPCDGVASPGSDYCPSHDPDLL